MVERTEAEEQAIQDFLADYFREEYLNGSGLVDEERHITSEEEAKIDALLEQVREHFPRSKGTLGLAIDFLLVTEQLSQVDSWVSGFDPARDHTDALDRYETTGKATLTFKINGDRIGIRPIHNAVIDLFRQDLRRTNFPSSPGHHTGEWSRYAFMLDISLQLSRDGRYHAVQAVIDAGLALLEKKELPSREQPLPDPFLEILREYPRKHPDEEAGTAYQALAYGFVTVEWSHLSLTADKLRTGSSRQHRYGDIDGYYGPDLVVSVEVKDKRITQRNVSNELGTMMDLAEETTTTVVAMCRSVETAAAETLTEAGVIVLSDPDLVDRIEAWDYYKQNRAVQGMIHYLENTEENPKATQRLLAFLADVDPGNKALAYVSESA